MVPAGHSLPLKLYQTESVLRQINLPTLSYLLRTWFHATITKKLAKVAHSINHGTISLQMVFLQMLANHTLLALDQLPNALQRALLPDRLSRDINALQELPSKPPLSLKSKIK